MLKKFIDWFKTPISGVFNPVILHPNVFPSGTVSLSLIDKDKGWKPQITTKEVPCACPCENQPLRKNKPLLELSSTCVVALALALRVEHELEPCHY